MWIYGYLPVRPLDERRVNLGNTKCETCKTGKKEHVNSQNSKKVTETLNIQHVPTSAEAEKQKNPQVKIS